MRHKVFCPRSACRHESVIEVAATPVPVPCPKCRENLSVYVVSGSSVIRLTPASFQSMEGPLAGMWKALERWPADREVLSRSATAIGFDAAPTWFIHSDGRVEEDVSIERIAQITREMFGPRQATSAKSQVAGSKASTGKRHPWWKFW